MIKVFAALLVAVSGVYVAAGVYGVALPGLAALLILVTEIRHPRYRRDRTRIGWRGWMIAALVFVGTLLLTAVLLDRG